MQEAFDLLSRASALRRVDADNDEIDRGFSIEEDCCRMRLSNGDGTTLWVYLQAESRADAMWAAYALGRACSDCFARSRKLLEATAALRDRLTRAGN